MQEEMYNGERRERDGPRGAALCQRGAVAWQRARTSYLTAPHKGRRLALRAAQRDPISLTGMISVEVTFHRL